MQYFGAILNLCYTKKIDIDLEIETNFNVSSQQANQANATSPWLCTIKLYKTKLSTSLKVKYHFLPAYSKDFWFLFCELHHVMSAHGLLERNQSSQLCLQPSCWLRLAACYWEALRLENLKFEFVSTGRSCWGRNASGILTSVGSLTKRNVSDCKKPVTSDETPDVFYF